MLNKNKCHFCFEDHPTSLCPAEIQEQIDNLYWTKRARIKEIRKLKEKQLTKGI